MFKIGDFSKLSRVSVKTLRYYDEIGLLKPAHIDPFTDYRYYSVDQLLILNRILALKDLGLSLEQIAALIVEGLPMDELRGMLRLRLADLQQHIADEQARLARIEARLQALDARANSYDIVLKVIAPTPIAGIRATLDSYSQMAGLFGTLGRGLQQHHLIPTSAFMGIYYDLEFRDFDIDAEAAVNLASAVTTHPSPAFEIHDLPEPGPALCVLYRGAYDAIGQAYSAVMSAIATNQYTIGTVFREIYLRGPESTANPAEYLTEIQIPVRLGKSPTQPDE